MNKRLFILLASVFAMATSSVEANTIVSDYQQKIRAEQDRIDLIDGIQDQIIGLKSPLQTRQATETYLNAPTRIATNIVVDPQLPDIQKIDQLRRVHQLLQEVNERNVHFYTKFSSVFHLIEKVQRVNDVARLESVLKNNVHTALNLIAFYIEKPVARPFLMSAASLEPTELLQHYREFDYKPFSREVLSEVARVAPMKVKTWLHSWNPVHQRVKTSEDRLTQEVYRIFKEKGTATKAFVLINDVYNGKLTIQEAHDIASNDATLLDYLIKMKTSDNSIHGLHSVNESLTYLALKRVRVVNDLHEESDAVRFASLSNYSAKEMYMLMVYSEDEIYTSTFLGMYKRMMAKMDEASTFEFLHSVNFDGFRTFIKMCAGYNTLGGFLNKMSDMEKQRLFRMLAEGIEKANDNLESAVAVADTYGSIRSAASREMFGNAIIDYYRKIQYSDPEAEKLYRLILNVFGIEVGDSEASTEDLKTLTGDRLFKDGKNIQQHFFFDDPDGRASYNHFLGTFRSGNWRIVDKGTYIIVQSTAGKKVEIYANKPATEYAGQDAIKAHFEETKRWPDVVVHRGHSYFADAAIESLTPNAEIVFLGSCGGYNNISHVLNYSPEAQIISSKQIGTMMVNDILCLELNEVIRKGQDIVWDDLWLRLDSRFPNGTTADVRFKDYVPPHKNLGAVLIRSYRAML